jgi:Lrp/AsnC family leucine-responsive transcriptional regulator
MVSVLTLDRIDRQLLAKLQQDNRRTVRALAEEVGISAPTCLRRMRRLAKNGVIRTNAALVNPKKLGYAVTAFVEVSLERTSGAALAAFEGRMGKSRQVMTCCEISGDVDYLLVVIARDLQDFSEFTRLHLGADRNIRAYRSQLVMRHVKNEHQVPV